MMLPAILLGLTGSLHCVGMCAPLTFAFMQGQSFKRKLFFYQLGRILTYTFLGLTVGYIGQVLVFSNWQSYTAFFLGVTLLLVGLFSLNLDSLTNKLSPLKWFSEKLTPLMGKFLFDEKPYRLFFAGVLNGLLPCGLVYFALMGAVAAGDMLGGGIFMTGFGLGTLPMLLLSVLLSKKIQTKTYITQKLKTFYPYAFILMGFWFIRMGILAWESGVVECH